MAGAMLAKQVSVLPLTITNENTCEGLELQLYVTAPEPVAEVVAVPTVISCPCAFNTRSVALGIIF
jgi:hypothetical protein